MSSSDPVPDVAPDVVPDAAPAAPATSGPPVSSPNSFFFFFLGTGAILIYYRLGWEAISTLSGGKLPAFVFWIWMVPIAGILGSIIVPSIGASTTWIILMSALSGLPILLSAGYVLLRGIPTSPPVLDS